jgi:hypothetical protein
LLSSKVIRRRPGKARGFADLVEEFAGQCNRNGGQFIVFS